MIQSKDIKALLRLAVADFIAKSVNLRMAIEELWPHIIKGRDSWVALQASKALFFRLK